VELVTDLTPTVAAVIIRMRQRFFLCFDQWFGFFGFFEQRIVHSSDERNMHFDEDS
jgi:hypothetical protein